MIRFLHRCLALLMLTTLTGGQWAMLQSTAWAGMLVSNLHSDSLSHAVTHTFDGTRPCCLCKAIAVGKDSEKKSDSSAKERELRIEFPPSEDRCDVLTLTSCACLIVAVDTAVSLFIDEPLTPPPRAKFT